MLRAIHCWFGDYRYCIKNSYIFRYDWESDYFCVSKDDYSIEVEVKISKADFKNDFKKDKHKLFVDKDTKRLLPNRFYYAVPKGLIDVKDVPEYAGLITVDGTNYLKIEKRAPFIHKKKHDFRKILCDKFYFQWIAQQRKINHLEYELKSTKRKIENFGIWSFTADKRNWSIQSIDYKNKKVVGKSLYTYNKRKNEVLDDETEKVFTFDEVKFI